MDSTTQLDLIHREFSGCEFETIEILNFMTPKHYSILLRFMKINESFMNLPEKFEKSWKCMVTELNALGIKKQPKEWRTIFNEWKDRIISFNEQFKIRPKYGTLTAEDLELWSLLKLDSTSETPDAQLSCMLDHLEIASSSPTLWTTIALEMESFGDDENELYWKTIYQSWCKNVEKKKKLIDSWNAKNSFSLNKPNIYSSLELRLFQYLKDQYSDPQEHVDMTESEYHVVFSNYCRTCLNASPELTNIHEESGGVSLAVKVASCAYVPPIEKDDGLPQNICRGCIEMLENAYKFRTICEKSDSALRTLSKEAVLEKEEVVNRTQNVYVVSIDGQRVEIMGDIVEETEDQEVTDDVMMEDECTEQMSFITDATEPCEEFGVQKREEEDEECEDPDDPDYIDSFIKQEDDDDDDDDEVEEDEVVEQKPQSTGAKTNKSDIKLEKLVELEHAINSEAESKKKVAFHQCSVCDVVFQSALLLKNHKVTHTSDKPYQCTHCGKRFKTRLSLKIHIRSHTGERPYVCETCGKAFKTVSAVNNHRAIHSEVKSFKCALCPYSACTKANLRIHDRTHSGVQPYKCKYCEMKFSTASNMQKHIRNIHEKMKTHQCPQCERCFFTRESVRKHMVTHSGLKPYLCPHCPTAYGWYNGLQKHMKMQHPGIKIPTEKSFYANQMIPGANEMDPIVKEDETSQTETMTIYFST